MANDQILSYSEDYISELLKNASTSGPSVDNLTFKQVTAWDDLSNLKKRLVRTNLHELTNLEHLKSKTIPQGMVVTNEPKVFLDKERFKTSWAHIANKCGRDWVVLVVETAKEVSKEIVEDLMKAENDIKAATSNAAFKKKLEEIERELKEFKENTTLLKIKNLKKSIEEFSLEKKFPYVRSDYFDQKKSEQDRSDGKRVRFRDHSYSSSSGDEETFYRNEYRFPSRGRNRGRKFFRGQRRGNFFQDRFLDQDSQKETDIIVQNGIKYRRI